MRIHKNDSNIIFAKNIQIKLDCFFTINKSNKNLGYIITQDQIQEEIKTDGMVIFSLKFYIFI